MEVRALPEGKQNWRSKEVKNEKCTCFCVFPHGTGSPFFEGRWCNDSNSYIDAGLCSWTNRLYDGLSRSTPGAEKTAMAGRVAGCAQDVHKMCTFHVVHIPIASVESKEPTDNNSPFWYLESCLAYLRYLFSYSGRKWEPKLVVDYFFKIRTAKTNRNREDETEIIKQILGTESQRI